MCICVSVPPKSVNDPIPLGVHLKTTAVYHGPTVPARHKTSGYLHPHVSPALVVPYVLRSRVAAGGSVAGRRRDQGVRLEPSGVFRTVDPCIVTLFFEGKFDFGTAFDF